MIGMDAETSARARSAYKYAVKGSLMQFFAKTEVEAEALVAGWWNRVVSHGESGQDLFLHAEAIDTAADLAEGAEVPITPENQLAYESVIAESERHAVTADYPGLEGSDRVRRGPRSGRTVQQGRLTASHG